MKLRNLFLTVVAGLLALTSCEFFENDKPLLGVTVDPSSVTMPQTGSDVTVTITTSQNWKVSIPKGADWVMVSPESGSGSATITIGAGANTGKDRKATISIKAGYDQVPVTITQTGLIASGDGSKEKPFSASEARAWILENLESGAVTSTDYYVAGKIHKVQTTFEASGTYGNAVFFMSDDGQASDQDFEAYQVYYLGKRKWKSGDTDVKVGDDVIVCGPLTNFNGTPETAGKGAAYLYKLNDEVVEVSGGGEQTEITASTVADFIKSDGNTYYRLTGVVSAFTTGQSSTGRKYMQFNLTDATGTILVYGFKDGQYEEWAEKIKNGGTAVVNGTYEYYAAKSQHEVMNTTIESFKEGEEQTEFEQLTVAAFIQKADPVKAYRLTGKVEDFNITNATSKYMNLTLKDDTGSILVYSFVDGQFDEWSSKIVKGGDITLRGYYQLYNNTPEVVNATIESFQADPNYKYFGVDKTAIKVAATATKATIKVVGNVAWTAMEATGAQVASGEGAQEFDYTFPANEDTENEKVYTVVVSTEAEVEVKSFTVTITQAKAGQPGENTVTFNQEQLAAAACKGAAVAMDDVISFANSSSYTGSVTELRVYQNQTLTFTAAGGAQITSITMVCTANGAEKYGPGAWGAGAPDGYTFDTSGPNGTWTGSATSVTFTASDKQVRIKELTVTYKK